MAERRTEGLDDLLRPALAGREPAAPTRPPWRLGSQVYVAVFGGALALGVIAVLNARRLRLSPRTVAAIAGLALLAEAALVAVALSVDLSGTTRVASSVAGVVAYGGAYLLQRTADRVHHYHARGDEPYASLLGPGLLACIAARALESTLVFT